MWEKKYARVSYSHTYIKKKPRLFRGKKTHGSHTKKTSRLVRKKSHSHIHSHTKFQFSFPSGTSFRSSAVSHPQPQPPPGCPVLRSESSQ
jgi:hypothetical protein